MKNETGKSMKKILAVLLAVSFLAAPTAGINRFGAATAAAQEYRDYDQGERDYDRDPRDNRGYPDRGPAPDYYPDQRFSREQLENLLAPVALYPDPLLAQILIAATFDDQIADAARFVRRYNDPYAIDQQPWDVSVKAVAHYPSVLNMMAERIDWTVALGQAYVEQPDDVMASVQHLRIVAHRAGHLASNRYQEVIYERDYVEIVPYEPEYIYVPVYDPAVVFVAGAFFAPLYPVITFGPPLLIGAWLNLDCDWHRHRVFYHGWRGGGHRWIDRSRPHVRLTNVYVNNNFSRIRVNREVVRRNVNVENLNRFTSVHREARFDNRARGNPNATSRSFRRDGDNRGDRFRGRAAGEQPAVRDNQRLRDERFRAQENLRARDQRPPEERLRGRDQRREQNSSQAGEERLRQARERLRGAQERLRARDQRPPEERLRGRDQGPSQENLRARDQRPPQASARPQPPADFQQRSRDFRQSNRGAERENRTFDRRANREREQTIRAPATPQPAQAPAADTSPRPRDRRPQTERSRDEGSRL
ncbi:MAG TPA: DUF3300 domain-containing protein [Candidatus Binatia bacterium]|jgi:hypothetical protein